MQRSVIGFSGRPKIVGEYALHLQCCWRLRDVTSILVGSDDRWYPPGDPFDQPNGWKWEDANRFDERTKSLLSRFGSAFPVVESVHADAIGGFQLSLAGGLALEAFPNDSASEEFWRFFDPSRDTRHFVVGASGIEGDGNQRRKPGL